MLRILLGIAGTALFGVASWGGFLIAPVMGSVEGIVGTLFYIQWLIFGVFVGGIAVLHFLPMVFGKEGILGTETY